MPTAAIRGRPSRAQMDIEPTTPSPPVPRRVRLVDVANEAGVSKGIASRILNNAVMPIRPETRRRVEEAAERLGYIPHSTARSLRRARTGALALVIPDLTNPVWARIIRGAFAEARFQELSLMVVEDWPGAEIKNELPRLALSGQVDGLVIASANPGHPMLDELLRYHIPHVFLHRTIPGSQRNVALDDRPPSRLALEHLVGLGHTRIGLVTGPLELTASQARIEAFRYNAQRFRLKEAPVVSGDFSEQGGALAAAQLLESHPRVTAVTVALLTQAVGVMHAAWERGVAIPAQLSVVAHDELALAEYLQPPVTTVKAPLELLGAAGVEAVVEQLGGAEPSDRVLVGQPELIARASTARPPG
jgi:DNA-binding LacI/PurR family transcriptional regulator